MSMSTFGVRSLLGLTLGLGLFASGCAHNQNTTRQPDTAAGSPTAGGTEKTPVAKNSCTTDSDCN